MASVTVFLHNAEKPAHTGILSLTTRSFLTKQGNCDVQVGVGC